MIRKAVVLAVRMSFTYNFVALWSTVVDVEILKYLQTLPHFLMGRPIIEISPLSLHYPFLCIHPLGIGQVLLLASLKKTLESDGVFLSVQRSSYTYQSFRSKRTIIWTFGSTLGTDGLFSSLRKLVKDRDVVGEVWRVCVLSAVGSPVPGDSSLASYCST